MDLIVFILISIVFMRFSPPTAKKTPLNQCFLKKQAFFSHTGT